MSTELTEIFDEYIDGEEHLPPECLLDEYHPANHQFYKDLTQIKRQILATGNTMPTKQREAVMLHRSGMKTKQIAERLALNPATIRKYIKQPESKRLHALLDHLSMQNDGPNVEHRKGILYRITVDNQDKKPRVAIAAIQEINRMSGIYNESSGTLGGSNVVNIQINGELLPRGQLDTMPDTYETRIIEGKVDYDPDQNE